MKRKGGTDLACDTTFEEYGRIVIDEFKVLEDVHS